MAGTISEIDVVKLLKSVTATIIGEKREEIIPVGAVGTVVLVSDGAYEIEFALPANDEYALATVAAADVSLHWKAPSHSQ